MRVGTADSWLTVVIGGTVLVLGWAMIGGLSHGDWLISIVLLAFALGIGWIYFGAGYTVTETELLVRGRDRFAGVSN